MSEQDKRHDEEGEVVVDTRTKRRLATAKMYKVLLHNDDYTTMEFVVYVLLNVFRKSDEEAWQIMLHVHRNGVGVAGVYAFDIAQTRIAQVEALARENEFPLRCSMEDA